MNTYGGERGECGLIISILEFPDAFLEFAAPSLCHFCDKRGCGWVGVDAPVLGRTKHGDILFKGHVTRSNIHASENKTEERQRAGSRRFEPSPHSHGTHSAPLASYGRFLVIILYLTHSRD